MVAHPTQQRGLSGKRKSTAFESICGTKQTPSHSIIINQKQEVRMFNRDLRRHSLLSQHLCLLLDYLMPLERMNNGISMKISEEWPEEIRLGVHNCKPG
jgi:hypothetical protein